MTTLIRLDTRGRLVIPTEYRESLNLKEGDQILLSHDATTNTLTISPINTEETKLYRIDLDFNDTPGSLAEIAIQLAELQIDLIKTESKSYNRGTKARWNIIADLSNTPQKPDELKKQLNKISIVEQASITPIARGCLHR